jgi:hypothetical protein
VAFIVCIHLFQDCTDGDFIPEEIFAGWRGGRSVENAVKMVKRRFGRGIGFRNFQLLCRNHLFVAERRGKLASHQVAGNLGVVLRPERRMETMNVSVVLSGQSDTPLQYQPPGGWLIS